MKEAFGGKEFYGEKSKAGEEVLKGISQKDLYLIYLKCRGKIKELKGLDQEEEQLLAQIKAGRKRNFRQAVYGIPTPCSTKILFEKYNKMLKSSDVFRTGFFYKDIERPVKVTYEYRESRFPVIDLRKHKEQDRMRVIRNVLAGETRREYDPEKDFYFKLICFIVGGGKMIAMVSWYDCARFPFTIQETVINVFGKAFLSDNSLVQSDEKKIQKIVNSLVSVSEKYWKKMAPFGKELRIPGEREEDVSAKEGKDVLYKTLDGELVRKLEKYCAEKKQQKKAVMLTVWGHLLGMANREDKPVIGLSSKGERLQLFPIRTDCEKNFSECVESVETQMSRTSMHSACSPVFLDTLYGKEAEKFFHGVFSFHEFDEEMDFEKIADAFIALDQISVYEYLAKMHICIQMLGQEVGIRYTYRTQIFWEQSVEKLHSMFADLLEHFLTDKKKKFNKEAYILDTDSDAEKLRKLEIAQHALTLQKSNLFPVCGAEEFMQAAEQAVSKNYLCDEVVIEEGQAMCRIGIVAKGSLEECMTGVDGIVKSVRIAGAGSLIGLEAFWEDNITQSSYVSVYDNAKVLWMERDVMLELLDRGQDNWLCLVRHMAEDVAGLKRLWTLE